MATSFWKRRLERLGERFSKCEAVELSMIRDEKPVSDASHKAYLADLWSDAVRKVEIHDKAHIKGLKPDNCPRFGFGHGKIGSIFFYAPSLLMMPRVDASRIWEKLDEMFVAAGGVLEFIPRAIAKQLNPLALTFTNRKIRWAACVFDAALQNLPGMTHAEMNYLDGQPCPGCWSTTLQNVMATSEELIDWLIAADDAPGGVSTAGIDAAPFPDDSAVVPAKTSSGKRQPPQPDGPLKPDGFRLNGIEIWGLAEDWQKVLTFVWERATDPPTWQDVATHLGVLGEMTDVDFRRLILKINKKTKGDANRTGWPETLQTVTRERRTLVVLRIPVRRKKASEHAAAKKLTANKAHSKSRSRTTKPVGAKQSTRNKRATKKRH